MTRYGQFCPIAKATEILGDKWTILIVRELLLGSSRFNEIHLLNKRLKELTANEVIIRKTLSGQKGHEYRLTAAGRELSDVVNNLAIWGMRWARGVMAEDELDIGFLMFDIRRSLKTTAMPDGETVLCFCIEDLGGFNNWWLVINGTTVDLCYEDPAKTVDLYLTARARDIVNIWIGDIELRAALRNEQLTLVGEPHLRRTIADWFALSSIVSVPGAVAQAREMA
jgi:DNA-binding HxlR family transcriptional regulator